MVAPTGSRYPLCNCMGSGSAPTPATPGHITVPGVYLTPIDVRIESLSSALTSLALLNNVSQTSFEVIPGLLYSQVASHFPSPGSQSVSQEVSPMPSSMSDGTVKSPSAPRSGTSVDEGDKPSLSDKPGDSSVGP